MSEIFFPKYVDIEPTPNCNLECPQCFGPLSLSQMKDEGKDYQRELYGLDFWGQLFENLKNRGVIGIVISGGEPTLYSVRNNGNLETIVNLVRRANEIGLLVTLSSNGTMRERLLELAHYLDWLALPIDGYKIETHFKNRGNYLGIDYVTELVSELKNRNPYLKIKIGTVANNWNYGEIVQIGEELIKKNVPVETWKIYEYVQRRKTLKLGYVKDLVITTDQFQQLKIRINETFKSTPFKIVVSSKEDRRGAYLFVYYDGSLVIPNVGEDYEDIIVGVLRPNDYSALDMVVQKIEELTSKCFIQPERNTDNYISTYLSDK